MAMQAGRGYGAPGARSEQRRRAGTIRRDAEQLEMGFAETRAGRGGGNGSGLARALGLFSIGLGLAQLTRPERVARLIGVRDDSDNRALMRVLGLRELATGVGIMREPQPESLLWGRVAGDVMDLLLLGGGLRSEHSARWRVALAVAAVAGVTVLDAASAQRVGGGGRRLGAGRSLLEENARLAQVPEAGRLRRLAASAPVHVKKSITVYRPVDEVYAFWHDFQNLPRFMSHLQSVRVTGPGRTHWKTKAPAGRTVEWDAELIDDVPNERIAWRSLRGADVENWGSVRFVSAPRSNGTEVHVELDYRPPGGAVGRTIAKLLGESPEQQVQEDLRAFKQVMETGEVTHSDASIHRRAHAAQPPAVRIELEPNAKQGVWS